MLNIKIRHRRRLRREAAQAENRDIYTELLKDQDAPLRVFAMSISPAINGTWESKSSCPLYQYGLTGDMTWELFRTLIDIVRNGKLHNEPHLAALVRRCMESAIVDGRDVA